MKTIITLFVLTIFLFDSGYAQITFEKSYGPTYFQQGKSVKQTPDGGYILVGTNDLIKTNDSGVVEWTKPYPADVVDVTADSNYIIMRNYGDIYFTKVDKIGDTIWSTVYDQGLWAREGHHIKQTNDGGFIVTGRFQDFSGSGMMMLKLNSIGGVSWKRAFWEPTSAAFAYGQSVLQTADNGYIMAGHTYINYYDSSRHMDIMLVKTDSTGAQQWIKYIGDSTIEERAYSMQETVGGGYILAGSRLDSATSAKQMYLLKLDQLGDTIWTRTYGSNHTSEFKSVVETNDFGYILTGYSNIVTNGGAYDVELRKVDSNGNTQWTRLYGGIDDDKANEIQQTTDGGYIITGYTNSSAFNNGNVYLLKLNESGDLVYPTAVYGFHIQPKVLIYPNPSTGFINIDSEIANASIRIFSLKGREVFSQELKKGKNRLDITYLAKGSYLYQLSAGSEIVQNGKFLIE